MTVVGCLFCVRRFDLPLLSRPSLRRVSTLRWAHGHGSASHRLTTATSCGPEPAHSLHRATVPDSESPPNYFHMRITCLGVTSVAFESPSPPKRLALPWPASSRHPAAMTVADPPRLRRKPPRPCPCIASATLRARGWLSPASRWLLPRIHSPAGRNHVAGRWTYYQKH